MSVPVAIGFLLKCFRKLRRSGKRLLGGGGSPHLLEDGPKKVVQAPFLVRITALQGRCKVPPSFVHGTSLGTSLRQFDAHRHILSPVSGEFTEIRQRRGVIALLHCDFSDRSLSRSTLRINFQRGLSVLSGGLDLTRCKFRVAETLQHRGIVRMPN